MKSLAPRARPAAAALAVFACLLLWLAASSPALAAVQVDHVVGVPGEAGSLDYAPARFGEPDAVAIDRDGNLYVADEMYHTVRRLNADGTATTLAGKAGVPGSADGRGTESRFRNPGGIVYDGAANVLYVSDTGNNLIRRVTLDGRVSTLAGGNGVLGQDGLGSQAGFLRPRGLAMVGADLYVADSGLRRIRKVTREGLVSTMAVSGPPWFVEPADLAFDGGDSLYVADSLSHQVFCLSLSTGSLAVVAGSGGLGSADETGSAAGFYGPTGIAYSPEDGNLYVADRYNHAIRRVTPSGEVTTVAGVARLSGGTDGVGAEARFSAPASIVYDPLTKSLVVGETYNHVLRRVTLLGATSVRAGVMGSAGTNDERVSTFSRVEGLAFDDRGNLYIADNHAIRKMTPDGRVVTLAGVPGMTGRVDGRGSTARFNLPRGLVYHPRDGNLYVADWGNHLIRRIASDGTVTTVAGGAYLGSADGVRAAASFDGPSGIAYAPEDGNLYVVDWGGNLVRRLTPQGAVTTIAGSPSKWEGDGLGAEAGFLRPSAVTYNPADGNLYVVQDDGSVRQVTLSGRVRTVVPAPSDSTFLEKSIASDPRGRMLVANRMGHVLYRVMRMGFMESVAGIFGSSGYANGEGPGARFDRPWPIAYDPRSDAFYLADYNQVIRRVRIIPDEPFADVPPAHPYSSAILMLAENRLVSGYGDGTFGPGNPVLRAQMAKMLCTALALGVGEELQSPFADLGPDNPDSLYPHEYVSAAYLAGLVKGYSSTTFRPYTDITRAQVITMVVRAAEGQSSDLLAPLPKGFRGQLGMFDPAHGTNVALAEWNGLLVGLQGYGPGWDPWAKMNRGEVSQVLSNLVELRSPLP